MKYIIISVMLILSISACKKDLLDTSPLDQPSPDNWYNNEKEAFISLTGIYSNLTEMPIYFDAMSDDLYNQYPWEGSTEVADGSYGSTSGYISWKWSADYQGIWRANSFIANMEEKAKFDQQVIDQMIAEAKFLRAFWYADLADFYEDVPLILAPQTLAESQTPKSPKADILTAVYKDLDDAIASLPDSYSAGDIGRATKGAAIALKARVKLFNGAWTEAASLANQIISAGTYELYPDYAGLFTVAAEYNSEVIFDQAQMKDKRPSGYSTVIRDWRSFVPLIGLSDDYYMSDGKPITDPASGYDPTNPFVNRDPRLYVTLQVPGETYNGEVYIPANDFSPSGMAVVKWVEVDNTEYWNSELNIILIRYAEVLLTYAEAQNEAAGPDESVYSALHLIRNRAGMPDVTPGLTQDQMRQEIRHERRIEMVGEGLRYSDIRRWKIAENVMVNGMGYNSASLSDPETLANWVFEEVVVNERSFIAPKHYVWPLPQSEIQVNENLVQNPLW